MANKVSLPKVMALRQRSKPVARAYELSGQNGPFGQGFTTPFPLDYDPDEVDYDNLPGPSIPPGAVLGKDYTMDTRDYRIPYGTVWPNSYLDPANPKAGPTRPGFNLGAAPRFGLHYHAEKTNVRLGMFGFVGIILIEWLTKTPILILLGIGTRLPPGSYT